MFRRRTAAIPGSQRPRGTNALKNLTSGVGNSGFGWYSLFANTTGNFNTGVGAGALALNTGENNTATGAAALLLNTTGDKNTANGAFALLSNTEGFGNTANGYSALHDNTTGDLNTATGDQALLSNTTGNFNTAIGILTLLSNTTGSFNTAIGYTAGLGITGNSNVCIGSGVSGVGGENNRIRISDNLPTGAGESACYIGGIAGQTVGAGGSTCYVDNAGKLGVFLSARRFKTDIADMGAGSEALLALRPVTFHYKPELDKTSIPQFGLVAEEVAEVNPDLVSHDAKGDIYTVRYEAVNAMLLNEFLKEHRKVQKLEAALEALTARLNEHDAKIQRVSEQIETTKPALQMADNVGKAEL